MTPNKPDYQEGEMENARNPLLQEIMNNEKYLDQEPLNLEVIPNRKYLNREPLNRDNIVYDKIKKELYANPRTLDEVIDALQRHDRARERLRPAPPPIVPALAIDPRVAGQHQRTYQEMLDAIEADRRREAERQRPAPVEIDPVVVEQHQRAFREILQTIEADRRREAERQRPAPVEIDPVVVEQHQRAYREMVEAIEAAERQKLRLAALAEGEVLPAETTPATEQQWVRLRLERHAAGLRQAVEECEHEIPRWKRIIELHTADLKHYAGQRKLAAAKLKEAQRQLAEAESGDNSGAVQAMMQALQAIPQVIGFQSEAVGGDGQELFVVVRIFGSNGNDREPYDLGDWRIRLDPKLRDDSPYMSVVRLGPNHHGPFPGLSRNGSVAHDRFRRAEQARWFIKDQNYDELVRTLLQLPVSTLTGMYELGNWLKDCQRVTGDAQVPTVRITDFVDHERRNTNRY